MECYLMGSRLELAKVSNHLAGKAIAIDSYSLFEKRELDKFAIVIDADANKDDLFKRIKEKYKRVLIFTMGNRIERLRSLMEYTDVYLTTDKKGIELTIELHLRLNTRGVGDIKFDQVQGEIKGPKGIYALTRREQALFEVLMKDQCETVDKQRLKGVGWNCEVSDNVLSRKLFELRKKILNVSELVRLDSVYGRGYSLNIL